jgi:hypothetical protein
VFEAWGAYAPIGNAVYLRQYSVYFRILLAILVNSEFNITYVQINVSCGIICLFFQLFGKCLVEFSWGHV